MIECMMHESFYRSGTLVEEALQLWAGWVCHAGGFSDCLPIWNRTRDVCLLFSGEEYASENELRILKQKGVDGQLNNASYLVELYDALGADFLKELNGHFSGLVIDLRQQKIILFNDRYGVGRIYFHENADGIYFSSEAKSLLRVLPSTRQWDLKSLGEFVSCGCVLQNRTLFSGVSLLPPGSAWTFVPGQPVRKETYFQAETWERQEPLGPEEYYEAFKETWARAVPRYFRGTPRAALSLTGGVDSRMILAWAPCAAGTLPTYTFGGRYRECADVRISRKVADVCRQQHDVIPVNGEFFSRFPTLAEKAIYVSDGAMDVTGAVDLYLQGAARDIAPVRVTGTNGGEILRSLVVFKPCAVAEDALQPDLVRFSQDAATTYAAERRGRDLTFTAFKQAPWYMGAKFVLERSLVTLRMPYFDNEVVRLVYRAPVGTATTNDFSRRIISAGNAALGQLETDRGARPGSGAAMARAQRALREFTFKAEYAYDSGMPQWLARLDHVAAPLRLERLFLGRHKIHHFRVHYRDDLAGYVRDVLLDPRSLNRSHVRGERLRAMVEDHTRGVRNYTVEIHKLLTLELIQRQLLEQN